MVERILGDNEREQKHWKMKDPKTSHLLDSLMRCATECWSCASACLGEPHVQSMTDLIRNDLDCADICTFTARLVARGSPYAEELLHHCATICKACETTCRAHADEHCQRCADVCQQCFETCTKYPQVAPELINK